MMRLCVPIELTVESPFLFPALQAGPFRTDAIGLRNGQDHALIPGDQLRGVLRAAMTQMYDETNQNGSERLIEELFGPRPDPSERTLADQRGALVFSDLVATKPAEPLIYSMVTIDDCTGAAKVGHLQQIELLYPAGQEVVFKGKIEAVLQDGAAKSLAARLKAAISRVGSIGAKKSAGFGHVMKAAIGEVALSPFTVTPIAPPANRLRLRLGLDRPFIVNADRIANNVFQSAKTIPGGTIKGALARCLAQAGHDPRAMASLSKLHIGHAHPCRSCENISDRAIPFSLVHLTDRARTSDFLIELEIQSAGHAIEALADWKSGTIADRLASLGLHKSPNMAWQARAHVRINEEGTAEEEMLFFTAAIDPSGRVWETTVDFTGLADEDAALFWGALKAGLDGVGSTSARVEIKGEEKVEPRQARVLPGTQDIIVTLETDGLLDGDGESTSAEASYRAYWKRALDAELVDFAARQDLRGGYLGRAFGESGTYRPFRITCAGSAFRLRNFDKAKLAVALNKGLPAPVINGKKTNWQNCPFQPENGWGEIRADWSAVPGGQP